MELGGLAARGGLWGNHGYETAYPATYTADDGSELDGRNRYTLTFDQDPPVGSLLIHHHRHCAR